VTTPAMDRPSWAVMAPASGGGHFTIGTHDVYWTSKGDNYRCVGCQLVRTMREFETTPECVT
jgi:hypothetical protein